ncbi:hypothetical protein GW7_18047 [Heterocephalus glaber]|uniref:Uncharacterized protein n=1 Tax=Heterocephalus glaber TaxID=10181 RepID=G5AR69_HETGA|nr:hypothetical protein GW7_18047 [Heterocephalus glaber]
MHGKWAVTWITIGKPKVQVEEEQRRSKRKRAEDSADQAEAQQAEAQRKQKIIDWVISVLENSPNQHHKRMVIGLCQRGMRQRDSGDPKPKAQPELQPNPEPQPDPVEKPESGADSAVSGAPRCCLGLRFASRAASASTMASTTTSTSNAPIAAPCCHRLVPEEQQLAAPGDRPPSISSVLVLLWMGPGSQREENGCL